MVDLRRAATLATILLAAAPGAPAQDAPPSAVEKDLQAAKIHMKFGRWGDAAKAYLAVFERNPGSPEVIRRVGDIEADLKLCLFRAQAKKPAAGDLFGEPAKSLEESSRRIVLSYPDGPEEPHWQGEAGSSGFLRIPLEGDITVDFAASIREEKGAKYYSPSATLCFDAEKGTGYRLYPGFYYEPIGNDKSYYSDDSRILRLDGGGTTRELARKPKVSFGYLTGMNCRVSMRSGALLVQVDGKTRVSASDAKYSRGLVAVSGARIWDVEVRGTVEEVHFRALVAAFYEERFREWAARSWKREEVLPAWARSAPSQGAAPAAALLPGDAPDPLPDRLAEAMEAWRGGAIREFLVQSGLLQDLPPRTAAYLGALQDMAFGRCAKAREALDRILQEEPGCAAALLHRGILRLRARDLEGAGADLEGARAGAASMPSLYLALATLALQDGALDRAQAHLGDAKVAGAWTRETERLARWVQRCREGPAWPKKYESRNRSTVVASDHSLELCREVAGLVERSYLACTGEFPKTSRPKAPLRVWVFSRRDGYLRYAADLGRNLENSAGAFIPSVGEMVLFVPDIARADFRATVRHEAFHAFLDGLVEDSPTWFNEGYAEWFEAAETKDGVLVPAAVHAPAADALRGLPASALTPLRTLLLMDHAAFMEKAGLHYAESWAFIQFLVERRDPPGRRVLMEYFGSLRSGLTGEEAFRKHFEPLLPALEPAFAAWIRARIPDPAAK